MPTYFVKVATGVRPSPADSGELISYVCRPEHIQDGFPITSCEESVKSKELQQLQTTSYAVVTIEGFVPLFIYVLTQHMHTLSGIAEISLMT